MVERESELEAPAKAGSDETRTSKRKLYDSLRGEPRRVISNTHFLHARNGAAGDYRGSTKPADSPVISLLRRRRICGRSPRVVDRLKSVSFRADGRWDNIGG